MTLKRCCCSTLIPTELIFSSCPSTEKFGIPPNSSIRLSRRESCLLTPSSYASIITGLFALITFGMSVEDGSTKIAGEFVFNTFTDGGLVTKAFMLGFFFDGSDSSSQNSSSTSMALSNIDLQPSAPPLPYTKSITSTIPTTAPSSSHTGNVKNLDSCIICKASNTVMSGDTASGFGVIMLVTSVSSSLSSFAKPLDIISLNDTKPTNSPSSTTKAAFCVSAINTAVSRRLVSALTTLDGLPANKLRNVGDD
mmetsp:Transcript_41434/g.50410  ORF Transcript_41434/g.50410 Transcript_41434/m.50410 type:complete len:252 (+) Transcript_41434:473-1228(+)